MNLAVIALQRAVRSWIQQKWDRKLSQQDRQVDNDLLHGEDPENTGEEVAEGKDIPSTDTETTDGGGQMQPSGLERPASASASAIMPTFLTQPRPKSAVARVPPRRLRWSGKNATRL